ncbi:LOW QUALITY PROTEIN: uncharacterized protein EMH_0071680 [Eimeria mitis]|uniref:Uncharacterized protein n=1 Tax=Eimeria mitis TaxID=44415 RepID=U6KAU5_9EIME|nr:LOW QUALITY PROTEIN: uncharacterized protein EMH_0071680 [Eimeria mitis]CDJ35155.1 hypothetical protein EMH_0071680 [Eimeria mitis]
MGLQRTQLRLAEQASPTRALKEASGKLPLLAYAQHAKAEGEDLGEVVEAVEAAVVVAVVGVAAEEAALEVSRVPEAEVGVGAVEAAVAVVAVGVVAEPKWW